MASSWLSPVADEWCARTALFTGIAKLVLALSATGLHQGAGGLPCGVALCRVPSATESESAAGVVMRAAIRQPPVAVHPPAEPVSGRSGVRPPTARRSRSFPPRTAGPGELTHTRTPTARHDASHPRRSHAIASAGAGRLLTLHLTNPTLTISHHRTRFPAGCG